ncbi:hypothetical protein AOQ84DRAFT_375090 [Glonium stellatum]|uniref:GPI anchored protein n=1 Tax=Glonium stellatum TaxID=574774 RepID=A0A8E2F465_9PEZI|nr:hypothetical protein AOQ84DRAFT_375090 [Glonium stellatum]
MLLSVYFLVLSVALPSTVTVKAQELIAAYAAISHDQTFAFRPLAPRNILPRDYCGPSQQWCVCPFECDNDVCVLNMALSPCSGDEGGAPTCNSDEGLCPDGTMCCRVGETCDTANQQCLSCPTGTESCDDGTCCRGGTTCAGNGQCFNGAAVSASSEVPTETLRVTATSGAAQTSTGTGRSATSAGGASGTAITGSAVPVQTPGPNAAIPSFSGTGSYQLAAVVAWLALLML